VWQFARGVALAGNVGHAWRAPTLFELFANGPHIGEARYEIGAATLVPEQGLDADLSLRWQLPRVHGEITAYQNRIDHFIYITARGDSIPFGADTFPVYVYQQANALLAGVEGLVEVAVTSHWTVRGRTDYVRGSKRAGGAPLPQIPPLRGDVGAEWSAVGLAWADRLAVRGNVEMVARQTRLSPFDIGTAGYALLELGADLERSIGGRPFAFNLVGRNVLNTRYRDFLSRYKGFALSPGRDVVLRISTEF
jgi:iron complex outermembrane recepter protein